MGDIVATSIPTAILSKLGMVSARPTFKGRKKERERKKEKEKKRARALRLSADAGRDMAWPRSGIAVECNGCHCCGVAMVAPMARAEAEKRDRSQPGLRSLPSTKALPVVP